MTPREVLAFQTRQLWVPDDEGDGFHLALPVDWNGVPLRPDGDLGARTRWAMQIAALDPRRQWAIRRANGTHGVVEQAANRHPRIDAWMRRCGVSVPAEPREPAPNNAWCAAMHSWCLSVPGLPERKEAGARALALSLRATDMPLAADSVWAPTGSWQAHIGMVIGFGPGVVAVREGNHGNRSAIALRSMSECLFATAFPMQEQPPLPTGLGEIARYTYHGTR
jgi:hypothetical protein